MFLSVVIEAEKTVLKINVIVYTLPLHLIYFFSQYILMENFDNSNERINSAWKLFSLKFKGYAVHFIDDSLKEKKMTIHAASAELNIPHYYNT